MRFIFVFSFIFIFIYILATDQYGNSSSEVGSSLLLKLPGNSNNLCSGKCVFHHNGYESANNATLFSIFF